MHPPSKAKGRPRSKETASKSLGRNRPFAWANCQSLVQRRGELLPFPYVCVNCGSALIDIRPYQLRNGRRFCETCRRREVHAVYLRYRPQILARGKARYYEIKQRGPVTASVIARKLKALRAVVAGGLDKITGQEDLRCAGCGCDDILFLEINHRNGGGTEEARVRGRMTTLAQSIIKGRQVHDLNILCGPCNRLEYLKRRYPGRSYPHVIWVPPVT